MKKSISIAIKLFIFAILTVLGIIYIINRSPVEGMADYEKQEMVTPNRSSSVIDQFFNSKDDSSRNDAADDDISLMGTSGRYDEVRIGGSNSKENKDDK